MNFVNYFDKKSYRKHKGTVNESESLTDPSFKQDSDINNIIYKHMHGMAPITPVREPVYDMNNYETSAWQPEDWLNQKAMIERKFLHLSPDMKAKFVTPANFFKYCSNPENYIFTENGMEEKPEPQQPEPQQPALKDPPATENK